MARQVITTLIDDVDGSEADRTVEFGLDGVSYSIDLSEKNVGKLRKALEPFLQAGTRIGRGGITTRRGQAAGSGSPAGNRRENQAIRAWAAENGHEVSERGRIPAIVVSAYRSTH